MKRKADRDGGLSTAVLAGGAVLMGVFVVMLFNTPPPPGMPAGHAEAREQDSPSPGRDRVPLPPLTVVRDGKPLQLAGPRSRPMLLHLWATWCGPCRVELPSLLALGARGPLEVVAVTVDDHFEDVVRFFNNRIPPEVAWDKDITLEAALGVDSLPTTVVVDRQGNVRMRLTGMQQWGDAALQRMVTEAAGP